MVKSQKDLIKTELLLRDYLASERTMMSVDRTFLSYVRTALTFFIAGISLLKFFDTTFIHILGWSLIPAAMITLFLGVYRTLEMSNIINHRANEDGYKMDFPQSIVRQHIYDFVILIRSYYRRLTHFFIPATPQHELKK